MAWTGHRIACDSFMGIHHALEGGVPQLLDIFKCKKSVLNSTHSMFLPFTCCKTRLWQHMEVEFKPFQTSWCRRRTWRCSGDGVSASLAACPAWSES